MLYKCKDTISFSILHIYTMSFFIIAVQQTYLTLRLDWIKAWQSPIPLSGAHSQPRRQARSPSPASPTPLGSLLPTPNGLAPEGCWAGSFGGVSRRTGSVEQGNFYWTSILFDCLCIQFTFSPIPPPRRPQPIPEKLQLSISTARKRISSALLAIFNQKERST